MITIKENGKAQISFEVEEGEQLSMIQKSLIIAIEEVAHAERAVDDEYKNAIWLLSVILRESLFDASQTNVAIGGRAYKER